MMNAPQNHHLTDEQFTDLLLGTVPAQVKSHLDTCSECSAEAQRVSMALGSFEQETRIWAECRTAGAPTISRAFETDSSGFHLPMAWAAAAVAVAVAITVGIAQYDQRPEVSSHAQAASAATDSQIPDVSAATLKADNDLLAAIDGKLRAEDTPPTRLYGLKVEQRVGMDKPASKVSD